MAALNTSVEQPKNTGRNIKADKLESGKSRERFLKRKAWFSMELARQQANRYQMALDEDYYDSIQWSEDEAAEVRKRGQNPVVYNEVKPTIDWLIGTERRMRRDFKVLARADKSKEAENDAYIKTQLLKYYDDVNRVPFERSMAADDAWKAGLGWIEVGVRADPEEEPIYTRAESWRNMVYDSLGARESMDPSRWRFIFRFREVDLDIAIAIFPQKEAALRRAANMLDSSGNVSDWFNGYPDAGLIGGANMPARWIQYDADSWAINPRRRVLLIECWNYEPFTETTGQGAGIDDRVTMRMQVSVMTEFETLVEGWSPFKHNKFPFIPVWAYRRKKDGAPYGPIRPIRGPQDSLNKRMSKAQFLLSVNQIHMEKSAIDDESMDLEEMREENAAPDGIVIYANNALSGNKVQRREHLDIAQGHMALADRDSLAIRSASGITGENRSMDTNATSGKAIIAKQEQGGMMTAALFDNLLLAHQLEGDLTLSLIEQYNSEEKTFSITGERFKLDYYTINQADPDTGQKLNDVTARKAKFVIGEQPWRQALAEAAFSSAMEMLGQLATVAPNVVIAILDLVFEWSDLPNKQSILQRIRQVTGQDDPEKGPTPEQQARRQRESQVQDAQFQAQMSQLMADVKEAEAKGMNLQADAILKRLQSLKAASEAAATIATAPGITPVADELLKSAGFQDANATQPVIDQPQQPQPEQAQPMAPQQGIASMQSVSQPAAQPAQPSQE